MDLSRDDVLREVAQLLESYEAAIATHPPPTSEIYRKGRDGTIAGEQSAREKSRPRAATPTVEDAALLRRFIISASFISAWYHLQGDRARRDKAAHSCATIVGTFGEDAEQVMRRYLAYERHWRGVLKAEGLVPSRWFTPSALSLIYAALAGIWMANRAPLLEAIGYGVTQFGYLVALAGLVFGRFRVLGIGSRMGGLVVGVAIWCVGVALVNL